MKQRTCIMLAILIVPVSVNSANAQMPVTKVVTAKARELEAPSTVTLVGTVRAVRRSEIGSEIAGIVKTMFCRQGDLVESGAALCKLDDSSLVLRLAEARANLDSLNARHEELLAGTREQELKQLKALFDESVANYDRWKFEMGRIDGLYQGSVSNDKEYQDTLASYRSSELRMIAAQAAYDLAVEGPRKEVIAQAAYEVAEQQAVVDRLQSDIDKTSIRAPFAGYVVERYTEVGQWIPAGGRVVDLADLATVLVRVDVPESALPYLAIGDTTRVKVDALKQTFHGRIKHIIRQADESARTFPVEIELENEDGLLAGGMFVRATVPTGDTRRVVAVPKDAVVEREGVDYVAVVLPHQQDSTMAALTAVTVGAEIEDWIAIRSGNVPEGATVVTRGNEDIMPFPTPVLIVDDKGTPVSSMPEAPAPTSRGGS